jgi:hypothetical protein
VTSGVAMRNVVVVPAIVTRGVADDLGVVPKDDARGVAPDASARDAVPSRASEVRRPAADGCSIPVPVPVFERALNEGGSVANAPPTFAFVDIGPREDDASVDLRRPVSGASTASRRESRDGGAAPDTPALVTGDASFANSPASGLVRTEEGGSMCLRRPLSIGNSSDVDGMM